MTQKRKLTVTDCIEVASGINEKTGKPWTKYKIEATDEHGETLQGPFHSFQAAAIGVLTEFEVTPYDGRDGMSYTLFSRKARPANPLATNPLFIGLTDRVTRAEQQIEELQSASVSPANAFTPSRAASGIDEDIPF